MSELGPDLCGAAGWKVVFSVLSASQHCQEVSSTGKNWVLGLPDCYIYSLFLSARFVLF